MLSKIPKTLQVDLIREDRIRYPNFISYSNEGKMLSLINPLPKKEASDLKKRSIITYHYSNNYVQDDIVFTDIPNTGFKLKMNYHTYGWRGYSVMPSIEVYHEKFKDLSYQPYINISYNHLMELMIMCGGKLEPNGEFPGTFKIRVCTTGCYPNYTFIKESDINYHCLDRLSIKYGELLETTNKTSKWIPGHIYVLSDRQVVIYLGRAKNIRADIRYREYSTSMTKLFASNDLRSSLGLSSKNNYYSENNALVIKLFSHYSEEKISLEFLSSDTGTTVTMERFVSKFIKDINICDSFGIYYLKLGEKNKCPKAIDLGKIVNFNQDFYKDDIINDLVQEINHKIDCGKLNFNENTKYMFYSDWFSSKISTDAYIKDSMLKQFFISYDYLLDYHMSKYSSKTDDSTIDKVINSILNYSKGEAGDWKDNSLVKFASDVKTILDGKSVFGEISKEYLKNTIKYVKS